FEQRSDRGGGLIHALYACRLKGLQLGGLENEIDRRLLLQRLECLNERARWNIEWFGGGGERAERYTECTSYRSQCRAYIAALRHRTTPGVAFCLRPRTPHAYGPHLSRRATPPNPAAQRAPNSPSILAEPGLTLGRCGMNGICLLQKMHEGFVIRRPECSADPDRGDRRIRDDDLVPVVSVELIDGVSQARVMEGEVSSSPAQHLIGLRNRYVLYQEITARCVRHGFGVEENIRGLRRWGLHAAGMRHWVCVCHPRRGGFQVLEPHLPLHHDHANIAPIPAHRERGADSHHALVAHIDY